MIRKLLIAIAGVALVSGGGRPGSGLGAGHVPSRGRGAPSRVRTMPRQRCIQETKKTSEKTKASVHKAKSHYYRHKAKSEADAAVH